MDYKYYVKGANQKMAKDKARELIESAQKGSLEAREELVMNHIKLVFSIANKYKKCNIDYNDLVDEGILGLLTSIDHFNLNYDSAFSTYAYYYVLKYINQYVRAYNHKQPITQVKINKYILSFKAANNRDPSVEEIAKGLNLSKEQVEKAIINKIEYLSLEELSNGYNEAKPGIGKSRDAKKLNIDDNYVNNIEIEETMNIIEEALKQFTEEEREIISSVFGLWGYEKKSMKTIANEKELSQGKISYTIRKCKKVLLKELNNHGIDNSILNNFN